MYDDLTIEEAGFLHAVLHNYPLQDMDYCWEIAESLIEKQYIVNIIQTSATQFVLRWTERGKDYLRAYRNIESLINAI